ncbi:MAG: response regulator [Elusimicrobia bacterium]|nr:response regulator [Elusimicrobiota bacterium]
MNRSILLIDDAPQVAGIISAKLKRESLDVVWKRDADSALQYLSQTHINLIILSTALEQKNAWRLLKELRHLYSDIPILMLLEQEETQEQSRAKALGCADCIIKPFKPTSLARTVKSILQVDKMIS